jgi:GntR family transcriptional regulator
MTRYQDLAADLRRRIAHGEFATGTSLPAEQRLADAYGVARGTVRNALASLERRGMVEPARGSGWVVSSALQAREFAETRTFPEWAESHGLQPGGRVVAEVWDRPTAGELRSLGMSAGEQVLRTTRVRTLDGRAVLLERTAYAPWVAPLIAALPRDEPSIARALLREGVRSVRGTHRVDAVAASSEDARLLGIPRSSPLLRVRREYADPAGRTIEVGDDRYLPASVSFVVEVAGRG